MIKKLFPCVLFFLVQIFSSTIGFCTAFDEKLWEKYTEIQTPRGNREGSLARLYLYPNQLGDMQGKPFFADLRVVTDRKEEIAWQIVTLKPKIIQNEITHQMQNLSLTEKGETWLELIIGSKATKINAVDIVTPDTDFIRPVKVFGSSDGMNWNVIRKDGLIFDIPRSEMLRQTRVTFPDSNFNRIMLKIINGDGQPLTIHDVKVLNETVSREQTYMIPGQIHKSQRNISQTENSIVISLNTIFPIDRLTLLTPERNFQRTVDVEIKKATGEWQHWARDTIFNFDTPTMRESKLTVNIPEIATREFRLVFKNLNSPPLSITGISGIGYQRVLVFKQSDRKMYLFWNNPLAAKPQYDLIGMITKQNLDALPVAALGKPYPNTVFAGNKARLPFTERYKYMLYILVIIIIAGLIFLQYRVFRNFKP
jgi:hypothetical protein